MNTDPTPATTAPTPHGPRPIPAIRLLLALSPLLLPPRAHSQETWIPATSPVATLLHDVAFGTNRFVAVGDNGVTLRSDDGSNWTQVDSGVADRLYGVTYGRGVFVTVGSGGRILISTDGLGWLPSKVTTAALNDVALLNGRFIAVGAQNTILVSENGRFWESKTETGSAIFNALGGLGGILIAVGDLGTVWTSLDATTWVPGGVGGFPSLQDIAWFRDEYVVLAGSGAAIYRSSSGTDWRPTPNGTATRQTALARGLNTLVSVGFDQTVFSSSDGTTWSERHRGTPNRTLRGVAYGAGRFVAVGDEGAILSSEEVGTVESNIRVGLEILDGVASASRADDTGKIRVWREGDSSGPTTARWKVGGAARPGIDFQDPGSSVVFEPGADSVILDFVPIANSEAGGAKWVGISLTGAEGAVVDPEAESVAVVLDSGPPPGPGNALAVAGPVRGRGAILELRAPPEKRLTIQSSSILTAPGETSAWVDAFSIRLPYGSGLVSDPDAPSVPVRYYRARLDD
ncbi:MAG: hypothetical protein AB7O66_13995 [Limisphaerales bacterium]